MQAQLAVVYRSLQFFIIVVVVVVPFEIGSSFVVAMVSHLPTLFVDLLHIFGPRKLFHLVGVDSYTEHNGCK